MRIGIFGAGSLGTILGALLTREGFDIELITRNVAHVHALCDSGAHIVGEMHLTVAVRALTADQMYGTYDVMFLLTKQHDNAAVAAFLKPFIGESGVLCTMQNGLPEAELAHIVGPDHLVGCTVGWGATLLGPGVVELTSGPETFSFNIGLLPSGNVQSLNKVASILDRVGHVVLESNFMGARWSKLLVNASFSGMATVLGCTFGEVVDNPLALRCAQRILKECIVTAKALHITLEPIQGKNIVSLFDYHNRVKQFVSLRLMPLAMKRHRALKPSMLQDIEKGKPCEIDAINGEVSKHGMAAGVATPFNDKIVELVHRIERGEAGPGFHNLDLFKHLL